jgi:LmbE family N-acetylglucosaminyl deacetylase
MVTAIHGDGTPERTWAQWGAPGCFAPWAVTGDAAPNPAGRVVIVAPHPDDEVLGPGGLARIAADAGRGVVIVAVTDGGASHPGSPTLDPRQLIAARLGERVTALARLGLHDAQVVRLELPDGGVAGHEAQLRRSLTDLLEPQDLCIATWSGDGHPDHEAVGRAADRASAERGAMLVQFPIWMWHWSFPGDPRVPWARLRRVELPPHVVLAKQSAIDAFATQVRALSDDPADAAILPPHVLARLMRPSETVIVR